jgi:putative thioredoxin
MLQEAGTITADAVVKDTTTQAFVKDVIEESKRQPVLVDFWAPWCGPCKMVAPELYKVAREDAGRLVVAKVNTEQAQSLARRFRINSIPTMALFKDGLEVTRQVGAMAAPAIRTFLEPYLRNGEA